MVSLKCVGDWLQGSGWTEALVQAKISSPGKADSFLKATHVNRTRLAHRVTASALYILQKIAYSEYDGDLEFDEWCQEKQTTTPNFHYWSITLQLEFLTLVYVSSIRAGNVDLYVASLKKIAEWCFSLDHTHYARWLPVHIRDMVTLKDMHPAIAEEF